MSLLISKIKIKLISLKFYVLESTLFKDVLLKLIKETKINFKKFGKEHAQNILKNTIKEINLINYNFNFLKNYHFIDDNGDIFLLKIYQRQENQINW